MKVGNTAMLDITAIGMGLMMTGVAVAVGGLMLEATLLMMLPIPTNSSPQRISRACRHPFELGGGTVGVLNSIEQASLESRTN